MHLSVRESNSKGISSSLPRGVIHSQAMQEAKQEEEEGDVALAHTTTTTTTRFKEDDDAVEQVHHRHFSIRTS